jgi:hypothetical protein
MEKLIVERIEEGIILLEKDDGSYLKASADTLSFDASEGDVIYSDGKNFFKNEDETLDRKQRLLLLQKKLSEKNKNK